jgi:hypothetical protein
METAAGIDLRRPFCVSDFGTIESQNRFVTFRETGNVPASY